MLQFFMFDSDKSNEIGTVDARAGIQRVGTTG